MASKKNQEHKIALYIRVSTEEQASNPEGSIKSQEQRLRQHVDYLNYDKNFGKVARVFVDRAKSGKDTNRPELQKLLQAIKSKKVSLVLVSEISRLSRSLKDFCEIWELMRKNECEFQSLREQFDTTTAAGEMVLYTVANIAQFERRQTSERISANFLARAQRGLFNGGSVPFGFELDKENRGHLKIAKDDAKVVREAFATFLKEGCISTTGKSLNNRGFYLNIVKQGGAARKPFFTVTNLKKILLNKAYIGLRVYYIDGVEHTTKACWPPIVEKNVFDKAQQLLSKARFRAKMAHKNIPAPYLLTGLARCGDCNDPITGISGRGRSGNKYRYYGHSYRHKREFCNPERSTCKGPHSVSANKLEDAVWTEVQKLVCNPEVAKQLLDKAQKVHQVSSNDKVHKNLKKKLDAFDIRLAALAEHLTQIPKNVSPAPIYSQMSRLEEEKKQTQRTLIEMESSESFGEAPMSLENYTQFTMGLKSMFKKSRSFKFRKRLLEQLIHKIEILPEGFRIHCYIGENHFNAINLSTDKKGAGVGDLSSEIFFKKLCSNRLTNGGGGGNRTRVRK